MPVQETREVRELHGMIADTAGGDDRLDDRYVQSYGKGCGNGRGKGLGRGRGRGRVAHITTYFRREQPPPGNRLG